MTHTTKHTQLESELLETLGMNVRVMDDIIGAYNDVLGTEHEPGWIFDLLEAMGQNKAAIAKAKGEQS